MFCRSVFLHVTWVFLCRGIGMCCAAALVTALRVLPWHWQLLFTALATVFCVVLLRSHFLEHCNTTDFSGRSFFSPESGASDAQFRIFLHIKMPLFWSTLSGCSVILFFDTSRCHFPERRNTHNFPEVPFASLESRAADAPFLEALYFFYHIAMPLSKVPQLFP